MTLEIHWSQIALRLALTLLAGGLLGWERSRAGHFAGLRTTLLVTLAASVAMIQMNLLLPTNGKPPDSYAVMDVMRLPLGILTGVGFIGAGAILRKGEMILGVTTAATLWFATVVGLCFGGGQLLLGSAGALLGFVVLRGLRSFERLIERYQLAELILTLSQDRLSAHDLRQRLERAKFHIKSISVVHDAAQHINVLSCQVRWPTGQGGAEVPPILGELEQLPGLVKLEWKTAGDSVST
jgi:putative Mg2+ transporter-C (MgtC) family protein